MISKVKLSATPSILLNYLYLDKKEKTKFRGTSLIHNSCYSESLNGLIRQFNEAGNLSTKCKRKIMHCSFSFSHNDKELITDEVMIDIANRFSEKFKLKDHPWVAVKHEDTDFPHFHMAVCTINQVTGKAISDSHNYKRMSDFSREIESLYKLETVLSPRKFLPKEQQNLPRKDKRKDALKLAIKESLINCPSLPEFDDRMAKIGYKVERSRGIAFTDNANVRFKGSQVGYSFEDIKNKIISNLDISPKYDKPKTLNLNL